MALNMLPINYAGPRLDAGWGSPSWSSKPFNPTVVLGLGGGCRRFLLSGPPCCLGSRPRGYRLSWTVVIIAIGDDRQA